MGELATLMAEHGVESLLERTQVMAALITTDGKLAEWNSAFGALLETIDQDEVPDLSMQENQIAFCKFINNVMKEQRGEINLPASSSFIFSCWSVPLPDGRILYFAEPNENNFDLLERLENLTNELAKVQAILEETRRSLYVKDVELKGVLAQVDEIAHTDPLTYIPNRKFIIGRLQDEVHRVERYKNPLSISMLDIDHFKNVNDTYGHTIGDQVLLHLSELLQASIRETDMLGRYGGEEFLILLPNTELTKATEQAGRLCRLVRETPFMLGDETIPLTVSIGVAQYRGEPENWHKFLTRADAALYKAKNDGRNRWAILD